MSRLAPFPTTPASGVGPSTNRVAQSASPRAPSTAIQATLPAPSPGPTASRTAPSAATLLRPPPASTKLLPVASSAGRSATPSSQVTPPQTARTSMPRTSLMPASTSSAAIRNSRHWPTTAARPKRWPCFPTAGASTTAIPTPRGRASSTSAAGRSREWSGRASTSAHSSPTSSTCTTAADIPSVTVLDDGADS